MSIFPGCTVCMTWFHDIHSSVYSVLCSMEHRGPRMSMLKIQKVMLDLSQWGALLFTWWVALSGERTLDSSNCHCNCTCEIEVGACPPVAISWGWELCKAVWERAFWQAVLDFCVGWLVSALSFCKASGKVPKVLRIKPQIVKQIGYQPCPLTIDTTWRSGSLNSCDSVGLYVVDGARWGDPSICPLRSTTTWPISWEVDHGSLCLVDVGGTSFSVLTSTCLRSRSLLRMMTCRRIELVLAWSFLQELELAMCIGSVIFQEPLRWLNSVETHVMQPQLCQCLREEEQVWWDQ